MECFLTLFIVAITFLYFFLRYHQSYWKRRDIAYDEPHLILGNLKEWRKTKHITQIFQDTYTKFKGTGPYAGFYFFLKHAVIAIEPEFIKSVLIKDFNHFEDRGLFYNDRDDPLSGNLFKLDGEKWRPLRQKLSSTFTLSKMKFMYSTVLNIADELLQVFTEQTAAAQIKNSGVIDVSNLTSRFTADVIGTCAFGLECNSLRNPEADFVNMGKKALSQHRHNFIIDGLMESFPNLARKLRMIQIPEDVSQFYQRIVRETIEYREKNNVRRNDFMDLMLDLKYSANCLTFNEILGQSFVFFIGGFETSSTTMGYALYELAQNKDIQDKVRNEINEVFKIYNDKFTYECMQDLKYLDLVMDETLRKYPAVPLLIRTTTSFYKATDPKYNIEKGTMLFVPIHAIHNDSEIYPEPEKFDPERFTQENIEKRPLYTYLPFGDGPRNCIGMRFGKMQVIIGLTYLIKNFEFSVCNETQIPIKLQLSNGLLCVDEGIKLRVKKL